MYKIRKPEEVTWENPLKNFFGIENLHIGYCTMPMCGAITYPDWGHFLECFMFGKVVVVDDDSILPEGVTNRLYLESIRSCDRCGFRTPVHFDYASEEDYEKSLDSVGHFTFLAFTEAVRAMDELAKRTVTGRDNA